MNLGRILVLFGVVLLIGVIIYSVVTPGVFLNPTTNAKSNSITTHVAHVKPKVLPSPTPTPIPLLNLTQYVNPFIGTQPGSPIPNFTENSANTFPGADAPFGMMQWSPDTTSNLPGGYDYNDTAIKGFSLTHLSGAGCTVYSDIPFMPFVGSVVASPAIYGANYYSSFSHSSEKASPGYYSVQLTKSNIKAELTVTPHTGLGRFTYPSSTSSVMLINTGGSVNGVSAASVQINAKNQTVTGMATSGHFCSRLDTYTIYFVATFNQPFTAYGTWNGAAVTPNSTSSISASSGAYLTFNTTKNQVVQVRVGISFVSIQNAEANLQAENTGNDFDTIHASTLKAWNVLLNRLAVDGGTAADTQTFYTSLYHAMLFPSLFSDDNDQYIGFDQKVHTVKSGHAQYANYSGWDIYRSEIPLLAVLVPERASDMMQSLVNDYQQSGCLPKWSVANGHTTVQNGDSADPIIAEAYAFGATDFDTQTALQAMIKGATTNCTSPDGTYVERPGLTYYLSSGYIPLISESVIGVKGTAAATLEYTTDDFAISQFAQALGDSKDASAFLLRAQNWKKLYNAATGFIEPRNPNGTFVYPFSAVSQNGFREGDAYQYTLMVPYNMKTLIAYMGGNQTVVNRLNTYFALLNDGPSSTYTFLGDEPSLSDPWDYDFAGQPWQTQATVRRAITQLYTTSPSGLPGNDDLGTMSAWNVWAAIGLFPIYPGVDDLVIGSPLFKHIALSTGKVDSDTVLHITASGAADNAPYVQSMTLNGASSAQLWQPFSTLAKGATLHFQLGTSANTSWGSSSADAPPSFD